MYDESILELEEIEGEDRWHPSVVEARYKTYRDAREWNWRRRWQRVLTEGIGRQVGVVKELYYCNGCVR